MFGIRLTVQALLALVSYLALQESATLPSHIEQNPQVTVTRTLAEDLEHADAVAKKGDAAGAIILYEAAAARARDAPAGGRA